MQEFISTQLIIGVVGSLISTSIFSYFSYHLGKMKGRRLEKRKNGNHLIELSDYPIHSESDGSLDMDLPSFMELVHELSKKENRNDVAARELIYLGDSNDIITKLTASKNKKRAAAYLKFKKKYQYDFSDPAKKGLFKDLNTYVFENYIRIAKAIGQTLPQMGVEVVLHNILNPFESIIWIENSITGRRIKDGATNLVIDLINHYKKGDENNKESKIGYKVTINGREFKCTTTPIYDPEYGLVGFLCINIDLNYLNESVLKEADEAKNFFTNLCKTNSEENELFLSKSEAKHALNGKRHWKQKYDLVSSN